ncbi:MAG TPA: glycosyltransferase family 39 protein [Solirubrobacteraceae bacterium]|nr:glycosyltransferase family 39 protein [Solirubrobacteraceae bacterium]
MSRHSLALAAIVVVAIGIRITYSVTTGDTLRMTPRDGQMAHNILADGRWFSLNMVSDEYVREVDDRAGRILDPASIHYPPGTRGRWFAEDNESVGAGAVMAGLWAVTGDQRFIQMQVLQGLLDGLATLLVYWIAVQLFKRRGAALLAAALYAVYPPIAWDTADPYTDIWAVDFTIAAVAIYFVAVKSSHRWRWWIACGVLAGIGAYFRPQVILIAPVLALVMVAATGRREALRRALVTGVVASLALVPWTIRNYEDFHAFIPTRSAFWQTMWGGLAEIPNGFGGDFKEGPIEAAIHRAHPNLMPESPEWDAYVKPYFIHAVEQHPLFYIEVLAHRAALATVLVHENLWMRRGAGAVVGYRGGVLAFVVKHPFEALEYALQPLVFLLAMLGLAFTWRRWRRQNAILLAVTLCVLVPYLAMHVEERYLLPAFFVYFIWIGLGADLLIERVRHALRSSSRVARNRRTRAAPSTA